MQVDNNAHDLATLQFNNGVFTEVRPSMGAWISYGLGTENADMPSYISIQPGSDVRAYGSAFLPAAHQGTVISKVPSNSRDPAIRYLTDPSVPAETQRRQIDFVQARNRRLLDQIGEDQAMEGVIDSFELAFRMQAETPAGRSVWRNAETLKLYGIGTPADRHGRACLLARRLSEAGVRFVQVTFPGWDHHGDIRGHFPAPVPKETNPLPR